jgi:hypothetical protein
MASRMRTRDSFSTHSARASFLRWACSCGITTPAASYRFSISKAVNPSDPEHGFSDSGRTELGTQLALLASTPEIDP